MKRILFVVIIFFSFSGCECLSIFDYIIKNDRLEVEKKLLNHPQLISKRDKLGKTILHYAVCGKSRELLDILFVYGADLNPQDKTGMTPLHVCAMWDRKGACKWLLDRGANPKLKDIYGDTPLHTSAIFGSVGVGLMLVNVGLPLDERNNEGKTPIDLAREYNNNEWLSKVAKIGE